MTATVSNQPAPSSPRDESLAVARQAAIRVALGHLLGESDRLVALISPNAGTQVALAADDFVASALLEALDVGMRLGEQLVAGRRVGGWVGVDGLVARAGLADYQPATSLALPGALS